MSPSAHAAIDLPFTPESALQVLRWGTMTTGSPASHRQIAEWCDRFWCQYMDVDAGPAIERLMPILANVETQWDLFLANTHSFEELRAMSLDHVMLPVEWFEQWLREASGED